MFSGHFAFSLGSEYETSHTQSSVSYQNRFNISSGERTAQKRSKVPKGQSSLTHSWASEVTAALDKAVCRKGSGPQHRDPVWPHSSQSQTHLAPQLGCETPVGALAAANLHWLRWAPSVLGVLISCDTDFKRGGRCSEDEVFHMIYKCAAISILFTMGDENTSALNRSFFPTTNFPFLTYTNTFPHSFLQSN